MVGKRGKLDDASKMAILTMIRDRKEVLFGSFTTELENSNKKQGWNDILIKAQSIEACNATRTREFVRDSLLGTWKSRTLAKRDNANKTGRGGGKDCVLTPVDEMILDIIGRDTPAVVGLDLPQTGCTPSITAATEGSIEIQVQAPVTPAHASTPVPSGFILETPRGSQQTTRKSREAELLHRKRKLQVELLEVEIYSKKLICLGMERSLKVQQSDITKCLIPAPQATPVPSNQTQRN